MPVNPFFKYAIASGWNVALNSLTNIEKITPTNDRAFVAPQAYGTYVPGSFRVRGDGQVYVTGYGSLTWLFAALTWPQYEYLRTTYCGGGWSGKVTIYTTAGTATYQRLNAILTVPRPADGDGKWFAFKNFALPMTRLATAT